MRRVHDMPEKHFRGRKRHGMGAAADLQGERKTASRQARKKKLSHVICTWSWFHPHVGPRRLQVAWSRARHVMAASDRRSETPPVVCS